MISGAQVVENPLPVSKFIANITGVNPFVVTKYKAPKSEVGVRILESGGQTIPVKHAGAHKGYEFSMTIIIPATGNQRTFLWKKHKAVLTRDKALYSFDMSITHLGPDDQPSIEYTHDNAWIKSMDPEELDGTKHDDNMTWKLEMVCDDFDQEER